MSLGISSEWNAEKAKRAKLLCKKFLETPASERFIFGRNVYSEKVAEKIKVNGFIDEFTDLSIWNGIPIIKLAELPAKAMVLACSGGRPLTVRRLLDAKKVSHLDYFMLLKWSGLDLPDAVFNEGCAEVVAKHQSDLDWLENLMADDISRETLRKLMTFRVTYDLDALEGFKQAEDVQYFEPFVKYTDGAPVFVDVGGFDGFTTKQFIRHAPNYKAVHIFEPEYNNQVACQSALSGFENIVMHPYGVGAADALMRFSASGSSSSISNNGELEISIRRLDDVISDAPTFIKMDIEGAEQDALDGARRIIAEHHPVLAICVYHRPSDFWEVPRKVLSMYNGYSVYLRHYTESIYETVMFFVPNERLS